MFSKRSIQSFVYDMIDVSMFPNEDIQKMKAMRSKNVSCIKT